MNKLERLPEWAHNLIDFKNQPPINRIAYTKEDIEYKCRLMKRMAALGMELSVDEIGNICGTLPGKSKETLALCSHTDSVNNGGQFDGSVGIIASLVAIENLAKQNKEVKNTLKVIICAAEESTRFNQACLGSKYLNGDIKKRNFDGIKDLQGISLQAAVTESRKYMNDYQKEYGIKNISFQDNVIGKDECETGIELHIEQAGTLQSMGKDIGIVNFIASPYRHTFQIIGEADHSGAANMKDRKDACAAASMFNNELRELAMQPDSGFRVAPTRIVSGYKKLEKLLDDIKNKIDAKSDPEKIKKEVDSILTVFGNANVIQDDVHLFVDVRLQSQKIVGTIKQMMENLIAKVENETGVQFNGELGEPTASVKADGALSKKIFDVSKSNPLNLDTVSMPSGAGHDIACMPVKKRALIFIPSGRSHRPDEHTSEKNVTNGANVLAATIAEL